MKSNGFLIRAPSKAIASGWLLTLILSHSAFSATGMEPETLTFSSGSKPVALLELYTSQGCSSCPPADAWLSQFKNREELWSTIVPVAFHVDYWDWIGWQDPFASKEYSARQRRYHQQGLSNSVYTPGFIFNGKEWRGWFSRQSLPTITTPSSGSLNASLHPDNQLSIQWRPLKATDVKTTDLKTTGTTTNTLIAHVAILGFDLMTPVKRGENSNRQLKEDFVVLWYQQHRSQTNQWQITLADRRTLKAPRYGIALWVTPTHSMIPLQAAGSWF